MKEKISFVRGFAFDEYYKRVVLIRNRTNLRWLSMFWNGIGTQLEPGKGIRSTQAQEFQKETGVDVDVTRWTTFHFERKLLLPEIEPSIYFMTTVLTREEMASINGKNNEVQIFNVEDVSPGMHSLHALSWLVPMAIDYHRYPSEKWVQG